MTAPANEGMLMIAAVRPTIKTLEIEQQGRTGEGQRRYELKDACARFRQALETTASMCSAAASASAAATGSSRPAECCCCPTARACGAFYYEARPALLTEQSGDADTLDLPDDAASLLPLYVASQLFKDDDLSQAVQMRNEFELGLSRLAAVSRAASGDSFVSARRWF